MSGSQGIHPVDEVKDSMMLAESLSSSNVLPARDTASPQKESQESAAQSVDMAEHAQEIAEGMNKVAGVFNTSLSFTVDESTGENVIQVVDRETEEVIRQIPPERMVRLMEKLSDVMGLMLDIEI